MVVPLTSASGLLALLEEKDVELKVYALRQLNAMVDQFWPEVSDAVASIESLYEDSKFQARELAALVASKIYYHLGEFQDAVQFALGAGSYFDLELAAESTYIDTIIGKCIDLYNSQQTESQDQTTGTAKMDPRLQVVVERVYQRCLDDGEYRQVIGLALEGQRLDVVEKAIRAGPSAELLKYTLNVTMSLIQHLGFRNNVLRLVAKLYRAQQEPDYITISQCFVWLDDAEAMATTLGFLVNSGDDNNILQAYQIAFDSFENALQEFNKRLLQRLSASNPTANTDSNAMETDDLLVNRPSVALERVRDILLGKFTISLYLEFLFRNNKTDLLILKKTKTALDARNSMYHSAISFANGFMNAGTTSDQFLRDSLDWMAKASNWAKFSATAQLGVIHRGNTANAMNLLSPYLPHEGVSSSHYSEGGALFALGIIHANNEAAVSSYFQTQLRTAEHAVVQHGACLGLGVAGMSSADEEAFAALKNKLFGDDAVVGEAAGLAMGLIMLGTVNGSYIKEMVEYAHDTQHEKIIRGLALGIALMTYGREEEADQVIHSLLNDKDPILRYGGVFSIALAYCGTSSNSAIQLLLKLSVSDASDDVRRAAVMSLGFVLVRTPHQVPRLVQLLSESYNPHVRYGSAMALGIACAGTGMQDALTLLEPLTTDTVDYVRQAAFIAGAMILIQKNETHPKTSHYRQLFGKVITAKHEDALARFGAVLGQGIVDAGGRNVTISLLSRSGNINMPGVVGMTLFLQFWYWFPLAHCLSLSFTPTALIGLNKDLKMPQFDFISHAKPSLFAYPAVTLEPVEEKVEKVATAVLSTTAKAKARAKKSDKDKAGDSMDLDESTTKEEEEKMDEDKKPAEVEKKKEEPDSQTLHNLDRVLPAQMEHISFPTGARYVPVKKELIGGILMMRDTKPSDPVELIEFSTPKVTSASNEDQEPGPPEPFEYTE